MKKLFQHLKVIQTHRFLVCKYCFKFGLYKQGLLHDLSKYSPTELAIYKYYTGTCSPHQKARDLLGYSPCWLHHYHTNKHHYIYWQDQDEMDNNIPLKMPYKYVIEMLADRIAACKTYNKENYRITDAWDYYLLKTKGHNVMHPETEYLLAKLLWELHESSSEACFFKNYNLIKKQLEKKYKDGSLIKEIGGHQLND